MPASTARSKPAPATAPASTAVVEPCRDPAQLREYIHAHWRANHILARDERMFRFTYATPWVDRSAFPQGVSVMCIYDSAARNARLLGFLGAITAPYPRPRSYWLALWHVLPELKGGGAGGRLLQAMQDVALADTGDGGGWIGTFGAGPEALPVYLKRGFCVRAARRWVFDPERATGGAPWPRPAVRHAAELMPGADWLRYRYTEHPLFTYDRRPSSAGGTVFRTETNAWGVVTHCCRLPEHGPAAFMDDAVDAHRAGRREAERRGLPHLMDAWSFESPAGPGETGWALAPEDLPSVFHPPEARGGTIYAVGKPFLPTMINKGDCDQDRPN